MIVIIRKKLLPFTNVSRKLMESSDFIEYVMKNGFHFTPELATKVCNEMEGNSVWSWKAVEDALKPLMSLYPNKHNFTIGDYTYLANMARTDMYPDVVPTEEGCLKYALAMGADKDGYEGLPFMRWISDLIGKSFTDFSSYVTNE